MPAVRAPVAARARPERARRPPRASPRAPAAARGGFEPRRRSAATKPVTTTTNRFAVVEPTAAVVTQKSYSRTYGRGGRAPALPSRIRRRWRLAPRSLELVRDVRGTRPEPEGIPR